MPNANAEYYNGLGHRSKIAGQINEALNYYTQAIQLDSRTMDYYFNRATCYGMLERYDEANKDLDVVIANSTTDAGAYNLRGYNYLRKGLYQKAVEDFNSAIKYNPNKADYYIYRAQAYTQLSDTENAARDMEKAITVAR